MELDRLIEKTGDGGCMLDEFLTGDSSLPVCMETDNDNWHTAFFEELARTHASQPEERMKRFKMRFKTMMMKPQK